MRRRLVFPAALVAALSLAGCGIPEASHLEIQVADHGMVLLKPGNGIVRSGETVIKIENYATHPVNMILAQTQLPATRLPRRLIDAVSPSDDGRIIAMTSRVDKAGVTLAMGAFPSPLPRIAELHVYLQAGKRYMLFDKLGGYRDGVAFRFKPIRH